MALVMVFVIGLEMLSDVGIGPSIQRSPHGDDPDFLNTAWTVQVIRGFCLWILCCLLAAPVSNFYNEAFLASALPVAGLSLVFAGFNPTRMHSATRHLSVGRLSILSVLSQSATIPILIVLALALKSPWALIVSNVISAAIYLVVMTICLPGRINQFCWNSTVLHELITFGFWIFLSTLCGFVTTQGDKAILGKFLSVKSLGIYNIGFFLATFPIGLATSITAKVLLPLYRERPPAASASNFLTLRKMRITLTAGTFIILTPFMFFGQEIVNLLYDDRFASAGAVVVALACMQAPHVISLTYEPSALAAGNSRSYFFVQVYKAIVYIALIWTGAEMAGLIGALWGMAAYHLLVYPAIVVLAVKNGAWDGLHDLVGFCFGYLISFCALWINYDHLSALS